MKTEPSKLEQALRDSPGDVFEARASNGVEVTLKARGEFVEMCVHGSACPIARQYPVQPRCWVLDYYGLQVARAEPELLREKAAIFHAIAEVLEMLNGEREWGEECSEAQ